MVERRRYIGDALGMRIHDADHERKRCRLSEIGAEHRRWYDSLEEALGDVPYRACSWCLGGSDGGSGDLGATATGTTRTATD